jgi:hypothetical protein
MKLAVNTVAQKILIAMAKNVFLKNQADLNLRLVEGSISVDDYIGQQKKINESFPSINYHWEDLKKEDAQTYWHERKHKDIFDKYGMGPKLHKFGERSYFVLDEGFDIAIKQKKYDINMIKRIQLEATMAPYLNKQEVTLQDSADIFYIEILSGNIKKFDLKEIKKAFQKYNWVDN